MREADLREIEEDLGTDQTSAFDARWVHETVPALIFEVRRLRVLLDRRDGFIEDLTVSMERAIEELGDVKAERQWSTRSGELDPDGSLTASDRELLAAPAWQRAWDRYSREPETKASCEHRFIQGHAITEMDGTVIKQGIQCADCKAEIPFPGTKP